MNIPTESANLSWMKDFFSGRNEIKWNDIDLKTGPVKHLDLIFSWFDPHVDQKKIPLVLPFIEKDGSVIWYGMTVSDQNFSQLIDDINSFVGVSYTNFRGLSAVLDNSDPSENALMTKFGNKVIKFRASQPQFEEHIYKSIQLYQALLKRRPDTVDRTQKPFGQMRSEFDLALLAGNESNACKLLDELKLSGRINAEQQKCFEIRLLSGLGRQFELASNQTLLNSVIDLDLPAQTLVDLILALYETYIEPIEVEQDLNDLTLKFKESISKRYSSFFRERKGIRHVKVLRAFLLHELAQTEPDLKRIESIYQTYPLEGQGYKIVTKWFHSIKNKVQPPQREEQQKSQIDLIKESILDENYIVAGNLCLNLLPDPLVVSYLLRCGEEAKSSDLTNKILAGIECIPTLVIEKLSLKDKNRLEQLKQSISKTTFNPTANWFEWVNFVSKNPSEESAISLLKENVPRWAISDYINDVDGCAKLATLLGNASGNAAATYREALPVLVDFFAEELIKPNRTFSPIYSIAIKILGWSGSASYDELEIISSLLLALLQVGMELDDYVDCVEDIKEIISTNNAPIYFDWALNISELLSTYPSPDNGVAKLNVFMQVISMIHGMVHRTSHEQRAVLESLAKDYGCLDSIKWLIDEPLDDSESNISLPKFSGLIGIYTLTEGAGQRAKMILEKFFPDARVETNADFVTTDRLTSLATNSDIFVFAWKSSKHAAYHCIKDARLGKSTMLLPSGKGAASIVHSCVEAITLMV